MTPHLEQRLAQIAEENGYGAEIQHAMRLAVAASFEWMPIEAAPTDGTEILAFRTDAGVFVARYTCMAEFMSDQELEHARREYGLDEDTEFAMDWFCADFCYGSRLDGNLMPTHWMPLPPPPKEPSNEA